jgi:hypothetical protein
MRIFSDDNKFCLNSKSRCLTRETGTKQLALTEIRKVLKGFKQKSFLMEIIGQRYNF